jgi:hypothetical protein
MPLEVIAQRVAADVDRPAIVLGLLDTTAALALKALKRVGVAGPFLATTSVAYSGYTLRFAAEPETITTAGFFTDGLYAAAPVLLDSGSAALLAFAERYQEQFGDEPSWRVILAYDGMRMLLNLLPAALRGAADTQSRRRAVSGAIAALNAPSQAFSGLSGPIWFDPSRGRPATMRMARFERDLLESAPLQLVPVPNPDREELRAGTVIELADGRFARIQRVVFAGIYLNEISRLDMIQGSFTADFYLWLRNAGIGQREAIDPAEIQFPDMRGGEFNPTLPVVRRDLADGATYRLWRLRGEFRNEFDLHRFPFDRQTLTIRMLNARAASDRIIYALDRRTSAGQRGTATSAELGGDNLPPAVNPTAFNSLTQWQALWSGERRDVLVTRSALGDPLLIGGERVRELSGFRFDVELRRRTGATLAKSLLPIGLMTLMMFASLWFPPVLVRDKLVVTITGALSGAVLLAAINNQLGNVAYTMNVEYVFYVFFGLALFCILSVSTAERFRLRGNNRAATITENATRVGFVLIVIATASMGWLASNQ